MDGRGRQAESSERLLLIPDPGWAVGVQHADELHRAASLAILNFES